jgi:hypothetical protein
MPHLLVTAGNDRNVRCALAVVYGIPRHARVADRAPPSRRIWDARLLHAMPRPTNTVSSSLADDDSTPRTFPMGSVSSDDVVEFADSKKGKGLLRGMWKHGKSCSSAYWDPWGGRVLTTSYDDHLRGQRESCPARHPVWLGSADQPFRLPSVWDISRSAFEQQRPLTEAEFGEPTVAIPHDAQTGRWLSILRAQWSRTPRRLPARILSCVR